MNETMTSRERMLAAMSLEQPDSVPVTPDMSNMIPCRLTGKPFWDIYLDNKTIQEHFLISSIRER